MNKLEALQFLANRIWQHGESKEKASGCLVPTEYAETLSTFNEVSDVLEKEYQATHYDRCWTVRGKQVLVNLYKNESFGACLDRGELVHSEIVEI
jgi:hypothetical protein